jgi:TPR repeat protein
MARDWGRLHPKKYWRVLVAGVGGVLLGVVLTSTLIYNSTPHVALLKLTGELVQVAGELPELWDSLTGGSERERNRIFLEDPVAKSGLESAELNYKSGNYKKAYRNWGLLAEAGSKEAQFGLGELYRMGWGVDQDLAKSIEWYAKAAEQGHVDAQLTLGLIYQKGAPFPEEAHKWYLMAAGNGNSMAQLHLANQYFHGEGVGKDTLLAAKWYREAIERGQGIAGFILGKMYENGNGVGRSPEEALRLFRAGAELGDQFSLNQLGTMYHDGNGVPRDHRKAVEWFRKAAEKGSADGQSNLGMMYEFAVGVPRDRSEAAKWYRKAADQGHSIAQFNLGNFYEHGFGVPRDLKEAMKLFRKSAAQGVEEAKLRLKRLSRPAVRADAEGNDLDVAQNSPTKQSSKKDQEELPQNEPEVLVHYSNGYRFVFTKRYYIDSDLPADTILEIFKEGDDLPVERKIINSWKVDVIEDKDLSRDFVVLREWNGGASCCWVIHAFQTKPSLKRLLKHENDHFKPEEFVVGKDTLELYDPDSEVYSGNSRSHANLVYEPIHYDLRNERWIAVAPGTGGDP